MSACVNCRSPSASPREFVTEYYRVVRWVCDRCAAEEQRAVLRIINPAQREHNEKFKRDFEAREREAFWTDVHRPGDGNEAAEKERVRQ